MFLLTPRGKTWKRRNTNFWGLNTINAIKWKQILPHIFSFSNIRNPKGFVSLPPTSVQGLEFTFVLYQLIFGTLNQHGFMDEVHVLFMLRIKGTVHPGAKLSYHQSNLATSYAHFKLFRIITNLFFNVMTQYAKCWGACHIRLLLVSLSCGSSFFLFTCPTTPTHFF